MLNAFRDGKDLDKMKTYLFLFSITAVGTWFFLDPFQKIWSEGFEGRLNFTGLALIAVSIFVGALIKSGGDKSGGEK
jgi:hypothetical protein